MPKAVAANGGADVFVGFEERRYPIRCSGLREVESTLDDKMQYEWTFVVEGYQHPETGDPYTTRVWTSQKWGDGGGDASKRSHLHILACALMGQPLTLEAFEALGYDDLTGRRATALLTLNKKGFPNVVKESMRPAGTERAAPAARRAADSPPATERQRRMLRAAASALDMAMDELDGHARMKFGVPVAELSSADADALLEEINSDEFAAAPF